jgi:hypothetical protein
MVSSRNSGAAAHRSGAAAHRSGAAAHRPWLVVAALVLILGAVGFVRGQEPSRGTASGRQAQSRNMRLVGHDPLQARSAYQPLVVKQGDRWLAYVGHHGGEALNPLTGVVEPNGTSVVDVTDPAKPRALAHIPGASGAGEAGGAQMVRVCSGQDLPRADRGKTYLLRTFGNAAHEVWDVSEPSRPSRLVTVVSGLAATHKNWWECETGIAYLVSDGRPTGWRTNRMTKIFDLGNPAEPRFIRDFGLPGQEPGSSGEGAPPGVHGPIAFGKRVYFPYGTSADGILQIVDRDRLLKGNPDGADRLAPTPENLRYPQLGRLDMSPNWGAHTALPLLGVDVPDFAPNGKGRTRDFVIVTSEEGQNECQEFRHLTFVVDVTTEAKPFSVANFQVPASPGDFCGRGGRFGPHASNESFTSVFYRRLVFIAYFNAGVRAVDVRDPYHPREVAYFIPATTKNTDRRCRSVGGTERCKTAIQTNNVEVDERGLVYLADRANTGLHIVELTGAARRLANLP